VTGRERPPPRHIGKEGNRLDDRITGLVAGPEQYRTEYFDPSRTVWSELVVPVLKTMDRATVAQATGVHRRSLERWLYQGVRPHARHEEVLTELAREHAAASLRGRGMAVPRELRAVLHLYADIAGEKWA